MSLAGAVWSAALTGSSICGPADSLDRCVRKADAQEARPPLLHRGGGAPSYRSVVERLRVAVAAVIVGQVHAVIGALAAQAVVIGMASAIIATAGKGRTPVGRAAGEGDRREGRYGETEGQRKQSSLLGEHNLFLP